MTMEGVLGLSSVSVSPVAWDKLSKPCELYSFLCQLKLASVSIVGSYSY